MLLLQQEAVRKYYKFHCGFYHGCNSGNFNRRWQHNFGLRRKAAYEPFETCRAGRWSINVGVCPSRWSHAGANLPLCLNVLLDACVRYSEFTSTHTSTTHVKRVYRHLNLEPWTSLCRIPTYAESIPYSLSPSLPVIRALEEVSPHCKLLLECRRIHILFLFRLT